MTDHLHLILLLIAITLFLVGAYRLLKYHSLNIWPLIKGKILSISENCKEVWMTSTTTLNYYFPEITYEYIYKNKKYESTIVSNNIENIWVPEVNEMGDKTPEIDKFWMPWKKGDKIEIFVNPNNPKEAVIFKHLTEKYKSHNAALIVSGVILAIVWFVLK